MATTNLSDQVTAADVTDDREARPKFWIALYTRSRSEKKASLEFGKLGIETYLPVQKQLRQWSDRKKLVDVCVIPMVIFLHIVHEDLLRVTRHPLILSPFKMPGSKHTAIIPDAQIEKLKFILGQSDYSASFDTNVYNIKDIVRISRGPLMGLSGEINNLSDGVVELFVSFGMFGCARIRIDKREVELL